MTRERFAAAPRDLLLDKFAKTFAAKATAFDLWPFAQGVFDSDGNLGSAIVIRLSKRYPTVANLELLHTFAAYRRRGLARTLVLREYKNLRWAAVYFRVSAEPDAVPFYQALGFRFWGQQKSGCWLCVHKIGGETPQQAVYDAYDPIVAAALASGRKGGLVSRFERLL